MRAWKFFIATFGCKVNQYESQSLREAWQKLGGEECDVPGEADVLCVNSCAITAKGERDARNAVFRLRREAPAARLILTGCAARLFTKFRPRPQRPVQGRQRVLRPLLFPGSGKRNGQSRGPLRPAGRAARAGHGKRPAGGTDV